MLPLTGQPRLPPTTLATFGRLSRLTPILFPPAHSTGTSSVPLWPNSVPGWVTDNWRQLQLCLRDKATGKSGSIGIDSATRGYLSRRKSHPSLAVFQKDCGRPAQRRRTDGSGNGWRSWKRTPRRRRKSHDKAPALMSKSTRRPAPLFPSSRNRPTPKAIISRGSMRSIRIVRHAGELLANLGQNNSRNFRPPPKATSTTSIPT